MMRLALHWQILFAMLAGAGVGSLLNVGAGRREVDFERNGRRVVIHDTTDRITISITEADGSQRTRIVDSRGRHPDELLSLAQLASRDPQAHEAFLHHGRSTARRVGDAAARLGDLFLRLLRMISIPLVITSLLTGVTGLGQASQLGRMFTRTVAYYVATSLLAITTGLLLVNLIRPGVRGGVAPAAQPVEVSQESLGSILFHQLETLIPINPIAALAQGDLLSIISFTLAFGIFTLLVGGRTLELISELARAAFDVMMRMTMAIIHLAPLGVLALMLAATATQGVAVFGSLAWYMATVVCGLAIHALVTLPLILRFVARRDPFTFSRAMSPALLTAFSSASSNAALPLTLASSEQRAGVPNRVSSFVLPLGATINMDGTALYEAVAVLFIAQLTPGIDFTFTQQIVVAVTALLVSIGAAGIPHAGLVMMIIILQAVNLPTDMQGLIIAVDRVLDMCRTAVNVWSDSCGAAVVARLEGHTYEPAAATAAIEPADDTT